MGCNCTSGVELLGAQHVLRRLDGEGVSIRNYNYREDIPDDTKVRVDQKRGEICVG